MQEIIILTITLSACIWTSTTNAFQLIQNNRKIDSYHSMNTFIVRRSISSSGSNTHWNKYLLKSSGSGSNESDEINASEDNADTTEDENPFVRDPEEDISSPTPVAAPVNPLADPLMRMATQDTSTGTGKTANIPLLGEVPIDGSFVVLAPAIGIGILGILSSFIVAFQSRDEIISALESVNPPPPKETKIDVNKCRGICSNQDESFDTIEKVMNSFVKKPPTSSPEPSVVPTESSKVPVESGQVLVESSTDQAQPSTTPSELNTVPLSTPVE